MSDYNVNMAQCIRTSTSFGYETVYNICNSTQSVVPWGSIDWLGAIVLIVLGVSIAAFMIVMLLSIVFDIV